ncbi:hypothetical protein GGR52DRAFT_551762 [Hypoxylon sp. FL1284]|nr:hypothetical protein GGR52DRAFT_551762 [Hypoxylon sp. FL1284]
MWGVGASLPATLQPLRRLQTGQHRRQRHGAGCSVRRLPCKRWLVTPRAGRQAVRDTPWHASVTEVTVPAGRRWSSESPGGSVSEGQARQKGGDKNWNIVRPESRLSGRQLIWLWPSIPTWERVKGRGKGWVTSLVFSQSHPPATPPLPPASPPCRRGCVPPANRLSNGSRPGPSRQSRLASPGDTALVSVAGPSTGDGSQRQALISQAGLALCSAPTY